MIIKYTDGSGEIDTEKIDDVRAMFLERLDELVKLSREYNVPMYCMFNFPTVFQAGANFGLTQESAIKLLDTIYTQLEKDVYYNKAKIMVVPRENNE